MEPVMSKLFDIAAISLIAASAVSVRAGVSDAKTTSSSSSHILCIMNNSTTGTETIPIENYTAKPDFNMVHSHVFMHEMSEANEFQALSIENSMPQLLEQLEVAPSAFIERMSF